MRTEDNEKLEPSYWAVIPAPVRYDQSLTSSAKLLYAEISSLTKELGYCYASNHYFAELYSTSGRTIQRHLDALKNSGYIRIEDGVGGSERRKIYAGINPFFVPHDKNVTAPMTELSRPHDKNVAVNLNNKKENKKEEQNPPKPPRGRAAAKKAPDHLPEEFDRLWKAYPRGEDKQGAIAEWDRLRPDEETIFAMKAALLLQKQSEEWIRGIGVPYFVRWLRHRRWEDDRIRTTPGEARAVEEPPGVAAW